jgi:pyruvate formate lyase activating enzyme
MEFRIKGFIEPSFSDWPGKVAAVLFLPSCNFRCRYCHNPELVLRPDELENVPLSGILDLLRKHRGWIDGVCVTGGEPTLHPWLAPLLRTLKTAPGTSLPGTSLGIKLDTNGMRPEILEALIEEHLLDYVAMDLKAPLQADRYAKVTGIPLGEEEMNRVRSSIGILLGGKVDHEFRTTLVPALIEEAEVYELARLIQGARRYTLQTFNPRETLDPAFKDLHPFDERAMGRMQKKVNEILGGRNEDRKRDLRPGPNQNPIWA